MMVISDEIFAGLWRLGSASAWERLHIVPDIACYAKLLTGKSGSQHDHIMRKCAHSAAACKFLRAWCLRPPSISSDGIL